MVCSAFLVLSIIAVALWLPLYVLGLALLAVVTAGASAYGVYDGGRTARWSRRQVVGATAAATAAASLTIGVAAVLGPSVLWLGALLTASSPPVVRWCCGKVGFGPSERRVGFPKRSTAELCRQWRESYEALRGARTDNQRLRIVMERQRCLDELGRRDPEGLQAWLASAASAAGDPARFLKSS
jgi:hypothetical protein